MNSVIILAAGVGTRMNRDISKQYIRIDKDPILYHTIAVFDTNENIDEIIIVIGRYDREIFEEEILKTYKFKKDIKIVIGGSERKNSVKNGLKNLNKGSKIVLIHDGVRPFITNNIIDENIKMAKKVGACVTGVKSKDTIKIVDKNNNIVMSTKREYTFSAQTPQTFKSEIVTKAFKKNKLIDNDITDDSMILEAQGIEVRIVDGSYENIKITTEEDLLLAENIIKKRKNDENRNRI